MSTKDKFRKLEQMAKDYKRMTEKQTTLRKELSNLNQKVNKQLKAIINHLIYGED